MNPIAAITSLFGMTEQVWERHASGWSVWTRVATGPMLPFALLSHVWIGWSGALSLVALLAVWLAINPRIFPKPRSTKYWHSKAVLGERVWLKAAQTPIPAGHALAARLLSILAAIGATIAVAGAVAGLIWPTALGTAVMSLGKLWFTDRMVWLYEDMKDATPEYRSWLY